ncbi:MAG: DUF2892 domain-containing protein [Acidobacteria bacterium]|nr:DUF2892 domain-containing protein [Acidobacteriota bacterium]
MKPLPFDSHRDDLSAVLSQITSPRANLGDQERIGSTTLGAALVGYGLKRRDWLGVLSAIGGAALVYRGATGYCQISESLGRGTRADGDTREALAGSRGVNVCEAVTIQRTPDELYREWRNLEALPEKMQHIQSVQERSDGTSHWSASGPAGKTFEWDAEILQDIPGTLISWRSLPGADVVSAGSVNFDEAGAHGTRVTVRLQYDPPGGKIGAYVAWLMRQEPSQQIREDLRQWKSRLEAGEAPTTDGQTSARASL